MNNSIAAGGQILTSPGIPQSITRPMRIAHNSDKNSAIQTKPL
jgi:hypothetical protein